jgi:nucleoside-diphosphate-sugar epimerase
VRIWITGAAGFVGRRLAPRCSGGHAVIGVDREVEITDAPRVARSLARARADAIVHLAAMSSPPRSLREPEPPRA